MPSRITTLPIDRIHPSPDHARKQADADAITALAASIRRFGLLSPLLVRRRCAGEYELIAGFRRLLALRQLGWPEADAVVLAAYDGDCILLSLVENIQREELHYLEEARACRRVLDAQGFTQEELAAILGRSPSALANRLRLLKLSQEVQTALQASSLTERHARALLRLKNPQQQLQLAHEAEKRKWSVRRLEAQVEKQLQPSPVPVKSLHVRDQRLVINAFREILRRLRGVGVTASSRVEEREDAYDIIVTVSKNP